MQKNKTALVKQADILAGGKIKLRLLDLSDCNAMYLSWLNDPVINQFLETRWSEQTLEKIKAFVGSMREDPANYLFAIIEIITGLHVGNIKLGPINFNHHYADISYFIGNRSYWGKGYASEAISLATHFAFKKLNLHRVQAGLYQSNLGSAKALEKAGYKFDARLEKQLLTNSGWEDHLWYVKFNQELDT
ncbi:MAG: GNAT family N-acetyltransferase [Gammaproteobacteria bacterium RIFCSPHIGHO2_12_FULL_35_23]|nr:MAG: GNAT family N-acetyltransferase [Gammaproteobacteria bacterium RIFCSPHIGHO2_12_FULL_35_23]